MATPEEEAVSAPMSLGAHLDELRRRLVVCVLALAPLVVAGMLAYRQLWQVILLPARRAIAWMGLPPDRLSQFFEMVPQSPAYPLFAVTRLAFYASLLAVSPVLLGQAWIFLSPALLDAEKAALRRIFTMGALLFAAGAVFGWMYGAPLALSFLIPFSAGLEGVRNLYGIDDYLSFLTRVSMAFGLASETPLVMWALARAGLLRCHHLRRHWRPVVMAVVVVAGILTPPEPFSQIALAVALLALMGAGYGLVRLAENKRFPRPPDDI